MLAAVGGTLLDTAGLPSLVKFWERHDRPCERPQPGQRNLLSHWATSAAWQPRCHQKVFYYGKTFAFKETQQEEDCILHTCVALSIW